MVLVIEFPTPRVPGTLQIYTFVDSKGRLKTVIYLCASRPEFLNFSTIWAWIILLYIVSSIPDFCLFNANNSYPACFKNEKCLAIAICPLVGKKVPFWEPVF